MIKKKYYLLLLPFVFLLSFMLYQSPVSAAYCEGMNVTDPSYRSCIDEILNSGIIKSDADCNNFPESIAQGLCKAYVSNQLNNSGSDDSGNGGGGGGGASGDFFNGSCRDGFLGLTSWDCGVNISNGDTLKAGIWQIVANVATDITVIAAYLVLGYVIYGGYQYIFAAGDPGKVASGRKTLAHAFIGLAIVMSAYLIMSTIRFALLGAGGAFDCNPLKGEQCVDPSSLVSGAIQWVVGIAGVVSLIFVVYGGISYITSAGDPGKLQKAKQMILYALIGLAIVALAELITAFVSNMIREADNQAINPNYTNSIISKEQHENQIL